QQHLAAAADSVDGGDAILPDHDPAAALPKYQAAHISPDIRLQLFVAAARRVEPTDRRPDQVEPVQPPLARMPQRPFTQIAADLQNAGRRCRRHAAAPLTIPRRSNPINRPPTITWNVVAFRTYAAEASQEGRAGDESCLRERSGRRSTRRRAAGTTAESAPELCDRVRSQGAAGAFGQAAGRAPPSDRGGRAGDAGQGAPEAGGARHPL